MSNEQGNLNSQRALLTPNCAVLSVHLKEGNVSPDSLASMSSPEPSQ